MELRGIEPLTSAVRLHDLERFFAVLRYFVAAEAGLWTVSRVICDTLRYARAPEIHLPLQADGRAGHLTAFD